MRSMIDRRLALLMQMHTVRNLRDERFAVRIVKDAVARSGRIVGNSRPLSGAAARGGDVGGLLAPDALTIAYGQAEAEAGRFWTAATPTGYRLVFADEACGEVGCHATFTEGEVVGIYALRLKVDGDGRVGEMESLFARKGDSNAFAPHRLKTPDPLFARIEPAAGRSSRAAPVAAADAYFDAVEHSDAGRAPIAERCERIENGLRTTRTDLAVDRGRQADRTATGRAFGLPVGTLQDRRRRNRRHRRCGCATCRRGQPLA